MLNKMNKVLRDQEFWIWKKRDKEKNPSTRIRYKLLRPILFPFSFFSFLCTFTVHLYRSPPPSILFFLPSFFMLSLHWKGKKNSPQKLNVGLRVIKGKMLQQEKRRRVTFFSFYFFSLLFLAFKIQCYWVEISCVILVVGVGTWCYW